jgi:hypothetical protein
MRFLRSTRMAWIVWSLTMALYALALGMVIATRSDVRPYEFWFESAWNVPVFTTVGMIILVRRPGHPIGRLFSAVGVEGLIQFLFGQYATVSLAEDDPLPGQDLAAWLSDVAQMSVILTLLFIVLLFPTGRLVSERWKPIAGFTVLTAVIVLLGVAFAPGPLSNWPAIENPFGIETTVLNALTSVGGPLGLVCFVAAITSLVLRFRRSTGDERQQIKWVAWAAGVGFALICGSVFGSEEFNDRFGSAVWMVGILGFPVSCAIAVLKYRLYDIDRLISRTLTYGALTAALSGGFLLAVLALQSLLPVSDDSPVIIAASTLAVIAAFGPLRARFQRAVDHRFDRSRYDAARAIETFGSRLRETVNIESIELDLVATVRDTMHPSHVSLWLRTEPRV